MRWTGLWDNPNTYGMLMGVGIILTIGLLMADRRWQIFKKQEVVNGYSIRCRRDDGDRLVV
jgi:hypothetical protein